MSLLSSLSVLQAGSQLLAGIVKAKLEGEATDFAARRYLMDTLSKLGPGLPAKAAQILNSGHEQGPLDLTSLLMKDSEVKDRISMQSPRLAEMIETLSFNALPGSLGQVHKAQLKDGRFVAIKIQYPGIDTKIHSQLATLLGATRFASQVKLQNFDHHGYLKFFGEKLAEELDYVREGSNQLRFRNRLLKQIQYKIPAYYSDYSSSSILVQEWVDCSSLQSQNLFSNEIRQKLAQHLLSLFLQQVFEFNELHGDLHFGNVGVSTLESHPLVLLDFGSTINLQKSHVAAIKEVVECIRKGNSLDALDTFCQLGFTRSALLPMASSLNDLLILFLRPLSSPTPFDPGQWNFREASAEILGSHRMQFRMAGPPWFLMFMKTVSGLVNCLKSLSSTIDISIVHDHVVLKKS
ncbi:MAG: AarF/UbiB family protein [Proteobacteria bacterium]|nr:AarF/UbiB family protein [Pseudomonadota bacterium]